MKWFKHDSDAHRDAKLKRVMHKYGVEGYGLYFYCLELISYEVTTQKLSFELEHDSEILAADLRMSREKVEDMLKYMVSQSLFENIDGRIFCMKMLHRVDTSQSGNPEFRKRISEIKVRTQSGNSHDSVMTKSGNSHDSVITKSALDLDLDLEVDLEVENNKTTHSVVVSMGLLGFEHFYSAYPKKVGKDDAQKAWNKLKPTQDLINQILDDIRQRVERGAWCIGVGKAFIPGPAPYLNGRKWDDEIIPRPEFKPEQDFSEIAREAEII